ncbi:MAG: lycopene cyclase domain-containing protein [Halobacteriales archaeon]|jgi:lycopene cyclase domain-containing protein
MELTYATFHALFVAVPIVGLSVGASVLSERTPLRRADAAGIAILILLALVYTAPWDRHLIKQGVWEYGTGVVLFRIASVPIEELAFIALQPILTGLWVAQLDTAGPAGVIELRERVVGVVAAGALLTVGLALIATPATFYLGAIVAWGAPILAIQWGFDWPYLRARWRMVAAGVAVPTAYLCVVDAIAIDQGVWYLSERYTTGLSVVGLPIEEAVFFLATNLFVVQGLVLFRGLIERLESRGTGHGAD